MDNSRVDKNNIEDNKGENKSMVIKLLPLNLLIKREQRIHHQLNGHREKQAFDIDSCCYTCLNSFHNILC